MWALLGFQTDDLVEQYRGVAAPMVVQHNIAAIKICRPDPKLPRYHSGNRAEVVPICGAQVAFFGHGAVPAPNARIAAALYRCASRMILQTYKMNADLDGPSRLARALR